MYIAIDEGYSVQKFKTLDDIVTYCNDSYLTELTAQDGTKITKKLLMKEFKTSSTINVYSYEDEDDLIQAKEKGSVMGIDWQLKFVKI